MQNILGYFFLISCVVCQRRFGSSEKARMFSQMREARQDSYGKISIIRYFLDLKIQACQQGSMKQKNLEIIILFSKWLARKFCSNWYWHKLKLWILMDANMILNVQPWNISSHSTMLLESTIPGAPGADYPTFSVAPRTSFSCSGLVSGYYADQVCQSG